MLTVFCVLQCILSLLLVKFKFDQIKLDRKIDAFRKTLDADREKFFSALEQLVEKQK